MLIVFIMWLCDSVGWLVVMVFFFIDGCFLY